MFVKFCGFTRAGDVEAAALLAVSAIGFVFHPSSPRFVEPKRARDIGSALDGSGVMRVGVFVDGGPDDVMRAAEAAGLDMLQLYDPGLAAAMERFLPVIRAYRVKDATDAARVQSPVPGGYALVDAWSPGAFGGSGRELPVEALRALPLRENVIVAGGIGAHNAASLIAEFAPWGIDVSSGIEDGPGMKSKIKMEQLMAIIEEASRHETTAG